MEPSENPVRVLYVMGAGRSGSTLLDMVLGSHSDVQGTGELATRDGWLKNEDCSCGRPVGDCPFWSEVRRVWGKQTDEDLRHYAHLQDSFERYRRLPTLLRERRNPSPKFREYADATRALFEAIREVSGKPVMVDSSKNPARALALSMTPGIELCLVHLVRDGRGVAASLNKNLGKDKRSNEAGETTRSRSMRNALSLWIGLNLLSEWVQHQLDTRRSARVRYEDLVSNPEETLSNIGGLAELDFSPVIESLANGGAVEAQHYIAGNRLRMSKSVRLEPAAGCWRNALSHEQKKIYWMLMGRLLRRYGYER